MPQFILDTSGKVDMHPLADVPAGINWIGVSLSFADLADGVQGYLEAAFFTDVSNSYDDGFDAFCEEHGEPGFSRLAPDSLASVINAWQAFEKLAKAELDAAYERDGYDETQAGRDFWYTRNGHRVGFWERDALKPDDAEYERLTNLMVANGHNSTAWGEALAKRSAIEAESLGNRLFKHAKTFGEVNVYLDPDAGLVHFE